VIDAVRARADLDPADLVIGGKSMGGRVASHIAARGDRPVSGVVLLGYPLHPPGKPAQWRTAHLPRIHVPMLFLQGTRDPFGTPDELKSVLATVPHVTIVPVEGGDHSFKVPRSSGTSQADVFATMLDRIAGWMEGTRHARL
jgi:predicted alpha/beta-hydrolase family hydrolase